MHPVAVKRPKKSVKTLKEKVMERQAKLEDEWNKTQRYRGKVSCWIGNDDLQRAQRSTFAMTRITNVIDKVKRSRVSTATDSHPHYFQMESS